MRRQGALLLSILTAWWHVRKACSKDVYDRLFRVHHYPQCQLRLARFRGTDKNEFLDQRQLHGHAFGLPSEAMQFLTRHLPVAGRMEAGLFERVDEPLFPPIALCEALVNAFCHRDYAQAGGAVSVGSVHTPRADGAASENGARRSRARRLWRVHRRGRE